MDSIDLTNYAVGDVIDLLTRKGRLLIAEGWAVEERGVSGAPRVLAFCRRATDAARAHSGPSSSRLLRVLLSRAASRFLSG